MQIFCQLFACSSHDALDVTLRFRALEIIKKKTLFSAFSVNKFVFLCITRWYLETFVRNYNSCVKIALHRCMYDVMLNKMKTYYARVRENISNITRLHYYTFKFLSIIDYKYYTTSNLYSMLVSIFADSIDRKSRYTRQTCLNFELLFEFSLKTLNFQNTSNRVWKDIWPNFHSTYSNTYYVLYLYIILYYDDSK